MLGRILICAALALILGVPFALRPASTSDAPKNIRTLVVITPHVQQIVNEFGAAFADWHERTHGQRVRVDFRQPGGTSEIINQLKAQYLSAAKAGRFDFSDPKDPKAPRGTMSCDLMFGGGSYDHTRLKTEVKLKADKGGDEIVLPMSTPAGFSRDQLDAWFGENKIGAGHLYDPEQYWIGTALSSFGIVYNKDVLARLGIDPPGSFEELTNPKLAGWIALADPRQSGSVSTTLDAVLSYYGWEKGWRILREVSANTRYFTNSAPKPPIDVSQGEAAVGLVIDFYGRGQAQAVLKPGQSAGESRVGYSDPKGAVYIDADPISILRGGPDPELAKRFVEFCLTEEAQALWQFPARSNPRSSSNPIGASGARMGPRVNELRRMPVRRIMYEKHEASMIDRIDPFGLASETKPKGWRTSISIMMPAFAIDVADEQRRAWRAMQRERAAGDRRGVLEAMERLFYAWPEVTMPDGTKLPFSESNYRAISAAWRDKGFLARSSVELTGFFKKNYERMIELEKR